jgi:hypothetical protein
MKRQPRKIAESKRTESKYPKMDEWYQDGKSNHLYN